MQTSLLEYYENGDISLMKQFLLTFPIFSEIHYFLGNQMFYEFLKCVQVHPVFHSSHFQLLPTSTYLFISTGILIPKKQKRHNLNRLARLSRTAKIPINKITKDILNQENARDSQRIKTTMANQLYNLGLLYNPNFTGQSHFFISNQEKKCVIIQLNLNQIPESVLQELRQKHSQKLKFIGSSDLFVNVQRYLVESKLSMFNVLKVSFDEFLMKKPSLRANHVFFLTAGQVEISLAQNDLKRTYLTKAPAIVGLQKIKFVKSVTEYCCCFYTEKSQVLEILKKNMEGKYKNQQNEDHLKMLIKSMARQKPFLYVENTPIRVGTAHTQFNSKHFSPRHQRSDTNTVSPCNTERNSELKSEMSVLKCKKNLGKTISEAIPEKKRYRIKEHFTNFMSDKYSQFVVKKTEFLNKKRESEDSILYVMKTLKPKEPEMSEINSRLKMQRLNRLQKCKENITMTKEESLNLVNIRNYEEFENSKVLEKIRRKIESNVDKRQRRNQHWKSYVPNLVSFNRISQANLCCK